MSEQPDYFSNHSLKLRFPWRLYHGPIVERLQRVITQSSGPSVLNIGSGPFLEMGSLDTTGKTFTLCDIDQRAMDQARSLWGPSIIGADTLEPGRALPYPNNSFDLVISMDVIEHVPEPIFWTQEALRVLKPTGTLFLTTPNYASFSLRVLELTALEIVARWQGFSRKHIHPTKMTPTRLSHVLAAAGAQSHAVEMLSLDWVLAAEATKYY